MKDWLEDGNKTHNPYERLVDFKKIGFQEERTQEYIAGEVTRPEY